MRQGQKEWEGMLLPDNSRYLTARVENFEGLDHDSFNLDFDDAYNILGAMLDEFTIGCIRMSLDGIDRMPTILEVKADERDENIKAHFVFSRLEYIGEDRLIAYYIYKYTSFTK